MYFNITQREGEEATLAVIHSDGSQSVIPESHRNYARLEEHLQHEVHDADLVWRLLHPAKAAGDALAKITDRVVYRDNNLFFDGEPIHDALGRHILARIEEGSEDWAPFVRFLLNLDENPSMTSRQHLYHFIDAHGLAVSEDGYLMAYKGVRSNGLSIHSGPHVSVDGVPLKGSQQVPNEVGSVISIPRSKVDDDRAVGCSKGLHVGSYAYAKGFGERLLLVKVNPRDVVSVPSDCENAKVRVAEYTVVESWEEQPEFPGTTWYDEDDWEPEDDWDDEEPEGDEIAKALRQVPEEERRTPAGVDADEEEPEQDAVTVSVGLPVDVLTLAAAVDAMPSLAVTLGSNIVGHKEAAERVNRALEAAGSSFRTTETSVRRWRRSHGVTLAG